MRNAVAASQSTGAAYIVALVAQGRELLHSVVRSVAHEYAIYMDTEDMTAVERLSTARRLLDQLAQMMRDNKVRSWIDIVETVAALAAPTDDEARALETLAIVGTRYRSLSAHRDGLDELYLPRPDWDEQKAATAELAALRDCITAILGTA